MAGLILTLLFASSASAITIVSSTTLGLPGNVYQQIFSIDEAADGSIYATGGVTVASSPFSVSDFWIGKFDSSLVLVASRTIADLSIARRGSGGFALKVAPDGTIWLGGTLTTPAGYFPFLARADKNLIILSSITFTSAYGGYIFDIAFDRDGHGYFSGYKSGGWLGKLTPSLTLLSDSTAVGTSSGLTWDSEGNLWTCGGSGVFRASKIAADISVLGAVNYNLSAIYHGCADIEYAPDGDLYLFGGATSGSVPDRRAIAARVGTNFVLKSSASFEGLPSSNMFIKDATIDRDGDIWFDGVANDRMWFGRYGPGLVLRSTMVYETYYSGKYLEAIDASADGSILAAGATSDVRFWIARLVDTPVRPASILSAPHRSSATWTWTASTSPAVTGYRLSGAFSGAIGNVTSYTLTGLSPGATYYLGVAAINPDGESSVIGSSVVIGYVPAAPAAVSAQVWLTSAAWTWTASTGPNLSAYRLSGAVSAIVTATSYTLTGLAFGATYYLGISAINSVGDSDVVGSSIVTPASGPPSITSVDPSAGGVATYGSISVTVPQGAFSVPVVLTLKTPSSFPSGSGATGVGLEITLDAAVQPTREIRILVPYSGALAPGLDESKLILARWDTRGFWVPLNTTVNLRDKTVAAYTNHFSLFQVMAGQTAAGVDAPRVFPNPLRPSLGHTTMTFTNLPGSTRLRVYTGDGLLVREMITSAAGMASWDGRDGGGRNAPSGVYFVLAESAGAKTFKVAIQR